MTLIFPISGSTALSGIQFGLTEIASGLALSKSVGSLFSRPRDAAIFQLLASQGVRVRSVPPWLQSFVLPRATSMHGNGMRRVQGPVLMDELSVNDLEGFISIVVLCTRYVGTVESITYLVSCGPTSAPKGDLHSILRMVQAKLAPVGARTTHWWDSNAVHRHRE